MKRLYWKPSGIRWQIHALIALIAIIGLVFVEYFKINKKMTHFDEKVHAARIMKTGMEAIRDFRTGNVAAIDSEADPLGSGLIGAVMTPITSNTGSLEAKTAALNPNWAAVVVDLLRKAGVKRGDVVGAAFSGSFPALNLAVLSAAEAMGVKLVIISSVAASTWGANLPELTWLDMERIVYNQKIISNRSAAASLGGVKDRAVGLSKEAKDLLRAAIARNSLELLDIKDAAANLDKRMDIYHLGSEGKGIKAFVNVGGGTVSVGTRVGKALYKPGLNIDIPPQALSIDSIMSRFSRENVPIIHLTKIRTIADKYGLPFELKRLPEPGEGALFSSKVYNKWLVIGVLVLLIGALLGFIRLGWGYRMFADQRKADTEPPEPMV